MSGILQLLHWTNPAVPICNSAGVHVFEGNCVPANATGFNTTQNNSIYVGNSTGGDWAEDCADWPRLSTAILVIYSVGVIVSQGLALGGVYGSLDTSELTQPWLSHCLPCYNPVSE